MTTRTEAVYNELRRELLNLKGGFEPGQRLRLLDLGQRFDASLSVIREALTRLAEQGLVVAYPQRGFRVRELSMADLDDLTRTRVEIETLALRQAVQNGDVAWEKAVVAAHRTLARTPLTDADGQISDDWTIAHEAFHQALLAGCNSPRLEGIVTSLRAAAELYRRWSCALAKDRARDLAGEHRRLQDFAIAGDAASAAGVLTKHIEGAPTQLMDYLEHHNLHTGSSR